MTPAAKLLAQDARRRFAALVRHADTPIDPGRAALLIAAEEAPRVCVAHYLALLDEMGTQARTRIDRHLGSPIAALNQYLFEDLGFAGNRHHYYDPHNSLLHYVLERRTGIPITLSIVYMEVGRRAGIPVEGVGLPGHFIVRARPDAGDAILVDPFNGQIIDEETCQQRLDMNYGGQVPLGEEHLRATPTRDILVRLLRNLKAIYAQAQLFGRALAVVERILLLSPQAPDEHRDRGLLLAQRKRLPEAILELQTYLRLAEQSTDGDRVREELKKLQIELAMLN